MDSRTLPLYKRWLETATPAQIRFVDRAYALCERNYEAGGDVIVECYEPAEVLALKNLATVKRVARLHVERAMDARWGEDSDPEVNRPAWRS